MTNKEITKVIFNNSEISALYYGDVLIWKKGNESQSGDLNFSGVFNDTVTGSNNIVIATFEDGTKETITIPYSSTTKEFNYTFEKPLKEMELRNKKIYKSITHIPNQPNNTTNFDFYFEGCLAEDINISNLDTSKVTDMKNLFHNCTELKSIDVSNFNTSNVTDMSNMFANCRALTTLDLSNFDTSKVTNMYSMLSTCVSLTTLDLSNFNTSNVNNMGYMFSSNKFTTIDVSNFNTSNVTNMGYMFNNCEALTTLDLSNFNTSNVTNMSQIFSYCAKLTTLDFGNFNTSNNQSGTGMFWDCYALTTVTGVFEGIQVDLDLHYSPLTNASAMVFINGLSTAISTTKKLTLKSSTYNTLTPEQIAVATSKGWTVISA